MSHAGACLASKKGGARMKNCVDISCYYKKKFILLICLVGADIPLGRKASGSVLVVAGLIQHNIHCVPASWP